MTDGNPDDDIDAITDIEALKEKLKTFRGQLQAAHSRMDTLEKAVEANATTIDDIETDVSMTQASVPEQSKTKLDNVLSVVEYAYEKKNGGKQVGVKVKSGEITAVIDGSKQTGLRLLDDIGGKFQWAEAEKPGGPRENCLKVRLDEPMPDRKEHVIERYSA